MSALAIVVVTEVGFLQRLFDTVPLTGDQWLICIGAGLCIVVVSEVRKLILRRRVAA
jgi:Ca2+-transporting ATPase